MAYDIKDIRIKNDSVMQSLFNNNIQRFFIFKRTERITRAVSLILPAFSQHQQIKDELNTLLIRILEKAVKPIQHSKAELEEYLLLLVSVLEMAGTQGMLSMMNVSIIKDEIFSLLSEIKLYDEEKVVLEEIVTPKTKNAFSPHKLKSLTETGGTKKTPDLYSKYHKDSTLKQTLEYKGQHKMSHRKDLIIKIIENKKEVSIKDISKELEGVGEKTIQRELIALVKQGVLNKKGERRWTMYSLKRE